MKRKQLIRAVLLIAGILFLTPQGQSQDFRFGIQANPGIVWVKPDNTQLSSDGVRFAFDFGLVFDYVFGAEGRYAFNSGLNMLVTGARLKGSKVDTSGAMLTSQMKVRTNYLEIPLTIKLRSNEVGYFTFYGQLGMVPAFAIRSRADYSYETNTASGIETISADNVRLKDIPFYPNQIDKVRPFNLGLHTEAGLEYGITANTALVAGIYFNTGFLDMFKDNDSERIVPRNMGLRIGILF